ncbi:hypothetical protein BDW60DRAFT_79921 [Aspergillus nidulans var. acristatus]
MPSTLSSVRPKRWPSPSRSIDGAGSVARPVARPNVPRKPSEMSSALVRPLQTLWPFWTSSLRKSTPNSRKISVSSRSLTIPRSKHRSYASTADYCYVSNSQKTCSISSQAATTSTLSFDEMTGKGPYEFSS